MKSPEKSTDGVTDACVGKGEIEAIKAAYKSGFKSALGDLVYVIASKNGGQYSGMGATPQTTRKTPLALPLWLPKAKMQISWRNTGITYVRKEVPL